MALGSSFWKFRPTSAVFFSHLRLDRSSSWTICWPRYDLSILGGHIPPRRGQLERDFVKTNWTLQKKTCKLSRLEKGSLLFLVLIILQEGLVHIFWGESTRRPQCGSFPLKMNGWNLTCIFHAPAFCRWFQPNWKICSSKWESFPQISRWKFQQKYWKNHHLDDYRMGYTRWTTPL